MSTLNLFELVIFMVHDVTFSCSPINKNRFKREFEKRISSSVKKCQLEGKIVGTRSEDRLEGESSTWRLIFRPFVLMKLVKRYHISGNTFVFLSLLHLLLMLHISIKALFHSILTGSDPKRQESFNNSLYPAIFGAFPEPNLFNNLILVVCVQNFSIRVLKVYQLIRGAIVNSKTYKEVRISQINLSYMNLFETKIGDLVTFFGQSIQHDRAIEGDPETQELHYKIGDEVASMIAHSSIKDLMYYSTLIDFEDCFAILKRPLKLQPVKAKRRLWHTARPLHRVDVGGVRNMMLASVSGLTTTFVSSLVFIFAYSHYELSNASSHDASKTIGQVGPPSNYVSMIRITEVCGLVFLQVTTQFDAVVIYIDTFAFIYRARKLIGIMRRELNFFRELGRLKLGLPGSGTIQSPFKFRSLHPPSNDFLSAPRGQSAENKCFLVTEKWAADVSNLNSRLRQLVTMSRLLQLEFLDIRRTHSVYINITLIGAEVCTSYIISLIFSVGTTCERILLVISMMSCIIPSLCLLFACTLIERTVSTKGATLVFSQH